MAYPSSDVSFIKTECIGTCFPPPRTYLQRNVPLPSVKWWKDQFGCRDGCFGQRRLNRLDLISTWKCETEGILFPFNSTYSDSATERREDKRVLHYNENVIRWTAEEQEQWKRSCWAEKRTFLLSSFPCLARRTSRYRETTSLQFQGITSAPLVFVRATKCEDRSRAKGLPLAQRRKREGISSSRHLSSFPLNDVSIFRRLQPSSFSITMEG